MTEGTVLVVVPIHNAQQMSYTYKKVEVPSETAEDQLSRPDDKRNATWRKVRYATDEEISEYYNKSTVVTEDKKRGRPAKQD